MGLFNRVAGTINKAVEIKNAVKQTSDIVFGSNTKTNDVNDTTNDIIKITLKNCKRLKTDLVECPKIQTKCKICSVYQDRVYSISGKDKRFPKLPEQVFIYGGFHKGCVHTFYPFTYGISTMSSGKKDAIKWSNRPFE